MNSYEHYLFIVTKTYECFKKHGKTMINVSVILNSNIN